MALDQHERKLDALAHIDDEIIEKQTQRRIALLNGIRRKRNRKRLFVAVGSMAASLALIASTVLLLVTLLGKAVPIYTGMSVSGTLPADQVILAQDERATPHTLSATPLFTTGGQALATPISGETTDTASHYAEQGQDIYITVHIKNPDSFEILSFTLNGKKYTNYMFEQGSDLENLIVKVNVGNTTGTVDYTIDAIKYVDGEAIKDVRMEGERTVQITVCPHQGLSQVASESDLNFTVSQDTQTITITGLKNKELTELIIPPYLSGKPVTAIDTYAFKGELRLTKVSVPSTVTTIGAGAFSGCAKLESITVEEDNEILRVESGCLIDTEKKTLISAVKGATIPENADIKVIGDSAFFAAEWLTTVTIPASIEKIARYAFYGCKNLQAVTYAPDGALREIALQAFASCSSLTAFTIPRSVTLISDSVFKGCTTLESLNFEGSFDGILSKIAFEECPALKRTVYEGGTYIAANGNPYYLLHTVDTNAKGIFQVHTDAKMIGRYAFRNCTRLTSVILPASITSIAENAFGNNAALADVYFGGTQSAWEAFGVNLPDTVTVHYLGEG